MYEDIPELCKSATLEDIKNSDYNLAPSQYIEFVDHDLTIDYVSKMNELQKSIGKVLSDERETELKVERAFENLGYIIK